MPKEKASPCFYRTSEGELIGEIVSDRGDIIMKRNFGKISDQDCEKIFEFVRREMPEWNIIPVELSGN